MTEKSVSFNEAISSSYLHPDAKPIVELLEKTTLIYRVEFQTQNDYETVYFQMGKDRSKAVWYFSQSKVLRNAAHAIKTILLNSPVSVTVKAAENQTGQTYYYFE